MFVTRVVLGVTFAFFERKLFAIVFLYDDIYPISSMYLVKL